MACCSLHLLKFCPIDDETPDFGDELSKLSSGRCRRQVSLRGRPAVRVPLCAEDVEETDEASLFDDEGYLVGLCPAHAELVLSRAVEGRACTGEVCSQVGPSGMSRSSPNCGVRLVGKRLYCEGCHTIRVSSGVTPSKPVRSDLAALAFEAPESASGTVSPLTCTTEGSPMSGVGGAFRRVGRVLSGVGGDVGHHAALVEGKGSSTSPVNERGDETPTVVPGAVGRTEHERAAEDGLRVQMDEMRMDLKNVLDALGTFSSRLGETERGLDRVHKAASEERSSNIESASEVRSTTVGAASKGDVGEEESSAFEKLLQARKVSVGVMEGVRGRPTPDDSSLSPTKRLERAMKGLEDDVEVQRSPQQVRRRAAEIADEVAEESRRVQEAIADRGRVLVDRYGYEGAATRISEMFDVGSFEAVVRALEVAFPGVGEAAAGAAEDKDKEEDEAEDESARGGDGDDDSDHFSDESEQKPDFEEVQYVHADGSTSLAYLLSENYGDGRPPMCLKIVATGKLKRASLGRVLRNGEPPMRGGGAAAPRARTSVRTQSSSVDSGSTSGKGAGGGFSTRESSVPAVGDTFDIFASFGGGGAAAAAGACDESVCSGVSSALGSESLIYDQGGASQGATSVASYASVARGALGATSAGFVGSGALAGRDEEARRYGLGDGDDGPGVMPMGLLTAAELQAELAKATITFDDETSLKPLVMPLLPSATRMSQVAEFDDAVFWLLRGAGDATRGPEFMPGLQASQVASQIFNTIHEAAIRGWDYPFPVEMTDFVVLAICTGSLGCESFEAGSASERRSGEVYYHSGRTLVLDDLVLKEDIESDWASRPSARSNHVWPAGDVARARVRVGHYDKASSFVRKVRGMAAVFEMFYNSVIATQLRDGAVVFEALAVERVNGRPKHPLIVLAVAFETLMNRFIISIRSQLTKLVLGMERTRKSTKRPALFSNLRLAMNGRDENRGRCFVWPCSFVGLGDPAGPLREVMGEMLSAQMTQQLIHGASAFTVRTQPSQNKIGKGASGAGGVGDGDEDDDKDSGAGSAAVKKEAEAVKKEFKKAKSSSLPRNVFGPGYEAGAVMCTNVGVVRSSWEAINKTWLELHQGAANKRFTIYCFAGTTHSKCGKDPKVCKAEWKESMPLADVRHGALPLPTYKMVAHDPSVEFHLLRVGLARGGGMLEHEEQVLPTDVRADMEKKFAVFSQQKAAAAKDAGSGGSSASAGSRWAPRTTDDSGGSVVREEALGSAHNVPPPGFAGGSRDEAFETFDMAESSWRQDLAEAPAGPTSGAHAFDISKGDVSALSTASAALGVADVPVGGGSVALWCRGRGGRTAPKSLVDLQFDDAEQDLDAVVNDSDRRPAPPTTGGTEVPACGLGEMFKFQFASADDVAREAVADWLTSAPAFASDVAAQGVGVRSYVRSLGTTVLLAETLDPLASGISPNDAWSSVRNRVLLRAATSTDAAIATWARSFTFEAALAAGANVALGATKGKVVAIVPAGPLAPGTVAVSKILGAPWAVHDHGELLAADGGKVAERAKCLYLAAARALGMEPRKLLASMQRRALQFLAAVPQPKPGEMVPEAVLYAFELAHDLTERDHPQMRASFLWFADEALAYCQLCFCCYMGGGELRVELFTGKRYVPDSEKSRRGFVECASSHARQLVPPEPGLQSEALFRAWEAEVGNVTGVPVGRWVMGGFECILDELRRYKGEHRMRDPATLWKCEICPSLTAPALRVHPRRYIGAGEAAGAEKATDPLLVMVASSGLAKLVSESRLVLAEISLEREAAAVAAARAVLAGAPPFSSTDVSAVGFGGGSERVGRCSGASEVEVDVSLSQIGELASGALVRQNTVEVQSQQGGGRLWREDECEGISHGVQSIIHGCERALEGLEWLESALTARTTSGDVMGAGGVENSVQTEEERPADGTEVDGVDPSKSPYEWDSSAHGTGGSPECSISLRQVDTHTAVLSHEGSDFSSSSLSLSSSVPPADDCGNGLPSESIHRPATLHVRRDATWLCSVVGCCRPSGRMANFADGTAVLVCCELCLGGSHTEECEATSALWRRRQQRQRRRTVNTNDNSTNDNYNDKSGGGSGCGQTSLRPDTAAAVPVVDLVVPGRFGRGFGRAPDATPTAGGLQHDCRTFGCFRQAGGPAAATAVGVLHCCLVCFETEGRRHSRECDGTDGPTGMQRPWAPAAPRDDAGRRTDVPLHMDESDDPSGMDEIDSLTQMKRQKQQQQQRAAAMTAPIPLPVVAVNDDVSAPISLPVVAVNDDVSASGELQSGREEAGNDGGELEPPIHRPATLHVRGTWLCSVVGCSRPSGVMAHFADGTQALVCCELCLGGERHTEECEASAALWRRRQQRLRRRQQESDSQTSGGGIDVGADEFGAVDSSAADVDEPAAVIAPAAGADSDDDDSPSDAQTRSGPELKTLDLFKTGVPLAASRSILPEMKHAVDMAIMELRSSHPAPLDAEDAVSELVDLWVYFPVEIDEPGKAIRIAQIEFVSNRLMAELGNHEELIRLFRSKFRARFGDHLSADRVDVVPGLTSEVREMLKSIAQRGCEVEEVAPRWDLRLKMDPKLAAEGGVQAMDKIIKDGRNGRIVLLSSLVEKQLLADKRRIMVAKFIRVAKRFLSGAVNPDDARWCNAQLDANTLTPSEGVGPGGRVRLPTQADATKMVLTVAMSRPGLPCKYSKHDVAEAFRLVWLAFCMCGLFAVSVPRWVLGLGHGHFYSILLALSFGSTISPGFFDFYSKGISMAHASFCPPHPEKNGAMGFQNLALVDDVVLIGVDEGLCLLWSSMVCLWCMRMMLGAAAANEEKGAIEAAWEPRKIVWGIGHDASTVHLDPLSLRLQMTPVKRERARTLVFDTRWDVGSLDFGRWQVQVISGNCVFWASVARVMWPLMMSLAQVIHVLPDGPVGVAGQPTGELLKAYEEVWRVMELLRLIVGSPHWWDSTFSGSVASTLPLRERLLFSNAEEALIWVGGDANMNGVAAGSWSDGFYAIVRTADFDVLLKAILTEDFGAEDCTEDELIVAIWEFLCILMIATYCAARWTNKIVLYVSDNQLVMRWITNLKARHQLANYFCGIFTLLMSRFRFEMYCVYINTKSNMWDEPSRVFDDDDIREGPGLSEIDAYMAKVFPGMIEVDVTDSMLYYLRSGGVRNAYELFGYPDPVARSLAQAREAPTASSVVGLTFVGLYSGILAFERELTALGGCARAIGEWSTAARAIGRLDLGNIEYFSDVLSGDHKHVDPDGVEGACITASCVDYSSAGSCAGLEGTRGWQVVDAPRVLLHFNHLLVSLVENVFGWITSNGGQSFAFYRSAMQRLKHTVWEPQCLNSRHLGMGIQSERALVFTSRTEFDAQLGEPRRLDLIRLPVVPMKRKLLPIGEVLRRRAECEVFGVKGSWQGAVVQNREFGPVKLGSFTFDGHNPDGSWRPGAKVRTRVSNQVWRVLRVFSDGRVQLRSGMAKAVVSASDITGEEKFAVYVYSIEGQAFRVTASDVAEPPLYQSKACYWETRCSPGFYRTLLDGDGWSLMGKSAEQLKLWRERAAEEAADSMLPKTVPPFTSTRIWELTGNSIAQAMAALGAGELHARWKSAKELLSTGVVKLGTDLPTQEDDLYDDVALKWRARTKAAEIMSTRVPDRHDIDDSFLNVALRRLDKVEEDDLNERDEALGYLASFTAARSAEEGAWCDGGLGAGSCDGALGAVRLRPTRARKAPELLQMPPSMRGGDRQWRERMSVDGVDFGEDGASVEGSISAAAVVPLKHPASSGSGSVRRPVTPRRRVGRTAARPRKSPCGARPMQRPRRPAPSGPPRPSATKRRVARVARSEKATKSEADGGLVGGAVTGGIPNGADAVVLGAQTADVIARGAKAAAAKPFGPVRPPTKKQHRKKGLAIAALEADDLFAKGDWNEIEKFATCRLPMYSVAWATLKGYESCWKHWVAFQYHAQLPIFLEVDTAAKRKRTSGWLLSFVALLAFGVHYRASTIKKCLMAIRFHHLAHDLDNPIEKCPRVWQGYRAIKRWEGPTVRKHPVTPEMFDFLDAAQVDLGLVGVIKRAARYVGVYLGCRCSEYLGPDIDWDKILLTNDVRPMKNHQYCEWSDDFDGVMVTFRGSKTDQYNEGCKRYVGTTGNPRCAVLAFREWYRLQPSHFERSDVVPMFTMPDGRVFGRVEMQTDLRLAAIALKLPSENIGTHSLRVSCATWLYQAGYDLEYIKRHGRWASNVVHVYLWEGSGFHSMCKRMSECNFVLHTHA